MIQVYALCTGFIELDRASMVSDLPTGQPWTVPVASFLVQHPRGRLLFDTGVHCQARVDPLTRLGPERMKRLTVKSREGDDVVPQLATLGLTPGDVRYVANSHLHFDHCGGNEFFPKATFLVQRPELEAARRPGFVPRYSPSPIDFDHALDYQMLDGDHDVFGDGSVIIVATPGHTPGHQSLFVNLKKTGPVILSGDLYHYPAERTLKDFTPFAALGNPEQEKRSKIKVEAWLKEKKAMLWIQHDLIEYAKLKKSPAYYE